MSGSRALRLQALAKQARRNSRSRNTALSEGLPLRISRFSSHPRWEMHPAGDEFLYVIEGALELALLEDATPKRMVPSAGEAIVVPRGIWHSPLPAGEVTLLHM